MDNNKKKNNSNSKNNKETKVAVAETKVVVAETNNTTYANVEELSKKISTTSAAKKQFEKVLKIKQSVNNTFEMGLLLSNIVLVFLAIEGKIGGNLTLVAGFFGIASIVCIIYNKHIIKIDEYIFKNRMSYLLIESIYKKLEVQDIQTSYNEYEHGLSIIESMPNFVDTLAEEKPPVSAYVKLVGFASYEYLAEALFLLIMILVLY